MRRMRELNWQYLLFIIPAFVAVLGIQYLNRKGAKTHIEDVQTVAVVKTKAVPPVILSAEKISNGDEDPGVPVETVADDETSSGDVVAKKPAAAKTVANALIPKTDSNTCQSVEFPGNGSLAQVSTQDWDLVIGEFHNVKQQLLGYIQKNRGQLARGTFDTMENRIKTLRVQRPPSPEEPDLAWRGIGVFVQDGSQLVRLGGGFVKLLKSDPARGRFELARLMAQTWAPCELASANAGAPWDEMLKCLGVNDPSGCGTGNYSEAGWVVSTVVAAVVSPPSCKIEALSDPSVQRCRAVPPQFALASESGPAPLSAAASVPATATDQGPTTVSTTAAVPVAGAVSAADAVSAEASASAPAAIAPAVSNEPKRGVASEESHP